MLVAVLVGACTPVTLQYDYAQPVTNSDEGDWWYPGARAPEAVERHAFALQVAPTPTPGRFAEPRHYIAKLEWYTEPDGFSYWRCPGGDCLGMVDLRSNTQAGIAGGPPQGYAWVTYDYLADICTVACRYEGLFIAGHATERVSRGVALSLEIRLGVTIATDTPHEILAELLTHNGDTTGALKWKPLLSDRIYLGGREVWRSPKKWHEAGADPVWRALALGVRQEDYRRIREESRGRGNEHYKRVLDKWSDDFGLPPTAFVPVDLPFEGILPHETKFIDDFNRADEVLDAGNWVENNGVWVVVNNEVQLTSTGGSPRASATYNSDLSSDDHYAQIDATRIDTGAGGTRIVAATTRAGTGTNTDWYSAQIVHNGDLYSVKRISGALSVIDGPDNQSFSLPDIVRSQADGSTIKTFFNGSEVHSNTDTSITGNLKTGIQGLSSTHPTSQMTGDNFEACDLPCEDVSVPTQRTKSWQATIN